MSKIGCPCGWSIADNQTPCPSMLHILTDEKVEELDGAKFWDIYAAASTAYECQNCGRILVFRDDRREARVYVPEPAEECLLLGPWNDKKPQNRDWSTEKTVSDEAPSSVPWGD